MFGLTRQGCHKTVSALLIPFTWPARSPDLSPIEHIWDHLGRRVEHPTNLNELEARLQTIWNEMSQDIIQNLYASMADRIASCIHARGGSTGLSSKEHSSVTWHASNIYQCPKRVQLEKNQEQMVSKEVFEHLLESTMSNTRVLSLRAGFIFLVKEIGHPSPLKAREFVEVFCRCGWIGPVTIFVPHRYTVTTVGHKEEWLVEEHVSMLFRLIYHLSLTPLHKFTWVHRMNANY
ncbi:transposable element Tcb1 transposase [Trichonephila clavipes]|nr:transposable element Tcb1 transposase [Trichonephila clavipes]